MKYRCGFVSNSSSSSFIIRWNKNNFNKCDKCGKYDDTLVKVAKLEEESYSYNGETEIKRLEENGDIVEMEIECSIHGILHDIILDLEEAKKIEIVERDEY